MPEPAQELKRLIQDLAKELGPEYRIILVTRKGVRRFLFLAFLVIFAAFVLGHVAGMTLAQKVCDGGWLGDFAYGNCPRKP